MKAAAHPRQAQRLAALRAYDILDTPTEADFDEIVQLASTICDAPISVVNLIDAERQWFKAEVGLGVRETPLDTSLCAHAILEDDFVEIPDTLNDRRMADNALVVGEPGLRFYAGALLTTEDGLPIGTLCVLDYKPRTLTPLQKQTIRVLARQVMSQLDLRKALKRQTVLTSEIDHRVKNSLQSVAALVDLQRRKSANEGVRSALDEVSSRIRTVSLIHEELYRTTTLDKVDLGGYLVRLGDLLRANAPDNVTIAVSGAPLLVDSRRASAAGMIVSEFAANSLKHAFPNERPGRISVQLQALPGGVARLVCEDDGVGAQPLMLVPAKPGIGLRIIDASVSQLGGTAEKRRDANGYGLTVTFAAE